MTLSEIMDLPELQNNIELAQEIAKIIASGYIADFKIIDSA